MWWKTDLPGPRATVKGFRQMRKNTMTTTVSATSTAETVVTDKLGSTMTGVNSGCGCGRHPRTTIESPPSDLVTRVFEYRKNMTMYRQSAEVQLRKKKEDGKKKEYPTSSTISYQDFRGNRFLDDDSTESTEDSSNETSTAEPPGGSVETSPISLALMGCFLCKISLYFFLFTRICQSSSSCDRH